jgi:septum formation protein
VFRDFAIVTLGDLSDEDIERYLAGEEWRGKAGAYNFSERLNAGWPITCTGDETTVMGLPMNALLRRLRRLSGELETAA